MPADTPPVTDHSAPESAPLLSEYRSDPDMAELIEFFLQELAHHAQELGQAFETGDSRRLRVLAHQLKGAAGGYGYPSISATAGRLEAGVIADEADLSSLAERVEELIRLCRQAAAGASSTQ